MKLTIIFKDEFEEHMKKQFGHFTNPQQVYGCAVRTHGRGVSILHYFGHRFAGVWMTFPDFTVRRAENA